MDSLTDLIDIYLKSWNDDDPQHRQHLLAPIWAENAIFTDPRTTIRGHLPVSPGGRY